MGIGGTWVSRPERGLEGSGLAKKRSKIIPKWNRASREKRSHEMRLTGNRRLRLMGIGAKIGVT